MKSLLLLALIAGPALAAVPTPATAQNDMERGRKIATEVCAACHGADGNSPTAVNPNIAGQHADYITLQLAHFKAGVRANAVMLGMATPLSADDMRAVALYYSRQKPKGLAAKDIELVKAGQALWRGGDAATGVPACSRRATARPARVFPRATRALPGSTRTTRTRSSRRSSRASAAWTRTARTSTAA